MMRSMLPFVLSKGVWLQIASATRQFSMSKAVLENAKSSYTRTTQENGIRNIVLNDPKTRNSLSLHMLNQLIDDIERNSDDELRCIVLSANGPIFSAGHNLKEFTEVAGTDAHKKVFSRASALMLSILNAPVPVIAKVDGLAAAAGCQLVATCDLVVCSERSSFSTPGSNFGIFCSTPGIAVSRSIHPKKALKMLFTGLPMSAQEACATGLVTSVVPVDQLNAEVEAICSAIKHKSRSVVALGKQFFYEQISMDIMKAYQKGEQIMVENIGSPDGQEGVRSFIEKRKPIWTHAEIPSIKS